MKESAQAIMKTIANRQHIQTQYELDNKLGMWPFMCPLLNGRRNRFNTAKVFPKSMYDAIIVKRNSK